MTISRQKFREIIFQALYSIDIGQTQEEDVIELLTKELNVSKKTVRLALEKVNEIVGHTPRIDQEIEAISESYAFNRIQMVERTILRIGCYELLIDTEIPPQVAISEAVRIAKKFGSPESASFVNALLDAIFKKQIVKKDE